MSDSPAVTVVAGQVQLGKPWYLSKKVWLALIGLAVVVYASVTGKSETVADAVATIGKVAGVVGIVAPLILSIAHVDGKERELALGVIQAARDLGQPDEPAAVAVAVNVPPTPLNPPGLTR